MPRVGRCVPVVYKHEENNVVLMDIRNESYTTKYAEKRNTTERSRK